MSNDIEEVKSRINVVDVVGDYVRLERAGAGQWKGLCPFHKEKSPSFTVSEERQLWHCFGCGRGGDVFSFVMEQEGMDFRDALVLLAERAGVTLSQKRSGDGNASADQKKVLYEILDLATKFYQKQLIEGIGTRAARPYLVERGINEMSMATFRLGFAPDGWRHILEFLLGRKYTLAQIHAAGLIIKKDGTSGTAPGDYYDRFRNRIMFPITDPMGRVIGFSARILPGAGDTKSAKYINTPESPVYHKSDVLYGIAQAKKAIKDTGRVVVVEGNMDVIAAAQSGVGETIAVSGTALTQQHARIMRRYASHVVLFFDNDTAGHAAAIKSTMVCIAAGLSVKLVTLASDSAKDAADIAREDPEQLVRIINAARDAMEVFFARAIAQYDIAHPEGRREVLQMLVPIIAAYASRVDQEYWIERLAQRAQVSIATIDEAVAHHSSTHSQQTAPAQDGSSAQSASVDVVQDSQRQRSDILLHNLLALVAQSDIAFAELMRQDMAQQCLAQKKALHAIMAAGAAGASSFSAAMDALQGDAQVREVLERVVSARSGAMAEVALAQSDATIQEEVRTLCAQMVDAWRKEERTRLIAALAQAEASGDSARQQAILAQIQVLM